MADTVFGMRILPQLDATGLSKVSSQLQKITDKAGKITLDAKSARAFEKMSQNAAKHFNDMIGKASLTGLTSAVGKLQASRDELERSMVASMKELATLQTAMQKTQGESAREAMAKRMKAIEEELKAKSEFLTKETKAIEDQINRRADALQKLEKTSASDFAQALGEGFTDSLGKVKSKDMEGLAKGLIGGMGKAGGLLEAVGGRMAAGAATGTAAASAGGTMAAAGASMAAAAAPLAVAAGALAAIVALLVAADEQAKDFNRSMLDGAGAADFAMSKATGRVKDLEGSLAAARQTAIDMSYEFREAPEDILKIVAAANQAGLTFDEMEKKLSKTGDKMEAYSNITRTALVYSRLLGQSTGDIAEQSAQFMHDLGGGLQTIENGFGAIYSAAQESGIGVKRFYGFVTQATSGMAMYNVRIAEAAALVAELGESLGEAEAAEFVRGLQKGFAAEGYTERFKRVIIAGQQDVAEIMGNSAEATAKEFSKRMQSAGVSGAVADAFKGVGVNIDMDALAEGSAAEVSKLAGLTEKQLRQVVTDVRGTDAAMGRQLETMIRLSKGVEGGMGEQAKALDELDMGGKLALMLQTLGDKPLSELSAIELAAFEQYSGISGEQLKALRRVDSQLRGNYEALDRLQKEAVEGRKFTRAEREEQARQFGAFIDENGRIVTGSIDDQDNQDVVDGLGEYLQSQGETLAASQQTMSSQEVQAKQMVRNTQSVFSFLDTIVKDALNRIIQLLEMVAGVEMSGQQEAIVMGLREQAEHISDAIIDADANILALEEKAFTETDPDAKRAAMEQLEMAKAAREALEAQKDEALSDASRIAEMETGTVLGAMTRSATFGLSDYVPGVGTEDTFTGRGLRQGGAYAALGGVLVGQGQAGAQMATGDAEEVAERLGLEIAPPTIDAIEGLTDAQKDEFKELKEDYPDLTAEGFLKAMKRREAEQLITSLGLGGRQDAQRIIRDVAAGRGSGVVQSAISDRGGAGSLGAIAEGFGFDVPTAEPVGAQDFIWRAGQGISRISAGDTIVGAKRGGPLDRAGGGSDQFTFNMTFNGPASSEDVKKAVIQGIKATKQARVGKGAR